MYQLTVYVKEEGRKELLCLEVRKQDRVCVCALGVL